MIFTDSLEAVMTCLGDWFVDGKYLEKVVFGAEDVCESLASGKLFDPSPCYFLQ